MIAVTSLSYFSRASPPRLQVVNLLFDLMEEALNITTLIHTAVSICSCLAPLLQAVSKLSNDHFPATAGPQQWAGLCYAAQLSLSTVSILRHYQRYSTRNESYFFLHKFLFDIGLSAC